MCHLSLDKHTIFIDDKLSAYRKFEVKPIVSHWMRNCILMAIYVGIVTPES